MACRMELGSEEYESSGKNPLLIETIISHIYQFLPLNEIKRFRLVCQKWNFEAEPLLRRRAKVRFTSSFRPSAFIEYSKNHLPDLPFRDLKFSNICNVGICNDWNISELQEFFEKWGKNIRSLEFDSICLSEIQDGIMMPLKQFNINPWIDLLGSNLVQLKIGGTVNTEIALSLDKLAGIKILSLRGCNVIVKSSDTQNRITPFKICLQISVTFLQTGNELQEIRLNNFVNLSKCSDIEIMCSTYGSTTTTFDLASDILNTRHIQFTGTRLFNWRSCNAKIHSLVLYGCPFLEETQMQLKNLNFVNSSINLSRLPATIEKLKLSVADEKIVEAQVPLNLPNLKSLIFHPHYIRNSTFESFRTISLFQNCSKLVDVELKGNGIGGNYCPFDWSWLPSSVKRVRMIRTDIFKFIGQDEHKIDLEILVLDEFCSCAVAQTVISKIKPKVLVMLSCYETDEDIISFVQNNKNLENIVVLLPENLCDESIDFETTAFSKYVDKKSFFYAFKNQFGTSLTTNEFENYISF